MADGDPCPVLRVGDALLLVRAKVVVEQASPMSDADLLDEAQRALLAFFIHQDDARVAFQSMEVKPVTLVARLRGRAETSRANARTYAACGYPGEAMRHNERAAAYDLAAEDAREALEP